MVASDLAPKSRKQFCYVDGTRKTTRKSPMFHSIGKVIVSNTKIFWALKVTDFQLTTMTIRHVTRADLN